MSFHEFIRGGEGWRVLQKTEQFSNPYLHVFETKTVTPLRPAGCTWTVVHRKAAVVIAPRTTEGKWILVRQERVPVQAALWEFPAGQIDERAEHDEALQHATALRELREETGCELVAGGELISLGHFFPSAGFTDEHSHLFLAQPVTHVAANSSPDENEAILGSDEFSTEEITAMIASGEIRDANTLSAYARMTAKGLL